MTLLPVPPFAPATHFVQVLCRWAQEHPHKRAYTFLAQGDTETHLTYAELDTQARAIAVRLQTEGATGERVLLLYPSGLSYIAAFLGCLYAGATAVPVYPPRPQRPLGRLGSVAQDAQARIVLTTEAIYASHGPHSEPGAIDAGGLSALRWITTDEVLQAATAFSAAWREPDLRGETLAFLQYTSGSTAQPKGVMVSHANLLANHRMMQRAFGQDGSANYVSWLPLFHDMGLIGTVLHPLFLGSECVLMAPETFVMKPLRWLQAMTRYGAHTSGGPNFAYDLCARKVTPEQKATLDLSGWKVAFNGAEPVRATTIERFTRAFESCGFRPETFYPCYGLAEATLFVSGGEHDTPPKTIAAAEQGLNEKTILPADDNAANTRTLVSCGRAWLEEQIRVVHPQELTECAPNQIGEIWIAGPNVAHGYWNKPGATALIFEAFLAKSGEGPFLRTGDLGFLHDDELYLVGRLKDLIVIAGRNYYPEEIEQTVEASYPLIRQGGCAAFSIDGEDGERLVIVAEVERSYRTAQNGFEDALQGIDSVAASVRQAIAAHHELRAHDVILLKPNGLPRTSSGKVQRHLCREGYLAGRLPVSVPA